MSSFSGERSRLAATADEYDGRRDVVEDDEEDFEEEEIWSIMRDKKEGSPRRTFTESLGSRVPPVQQSAPVHIPDWSKIYNNKNKNKKKGKSSEHNNEEEEEDDDDGEEIVPPHEWIARKVARSQISPFSVFEGRGRTLKGRDLRKVRNAILTRTGFIE